MFTEVNIYPSCSPCLNTIESDTMRSGRPTGASVNPLLPLLPFCSISGFGEWNR